MSRADDADRRIAACMAIAAKGQTLVDKLCVAKNEKVGVYGFVFHRDGEWIHEVIGKWS